MAEIRQQPVIDEKVLEKIKVEEELRLREERRRIEQEEKDAAMAKALVESPSSSDSSFDEQILAAIAKAHNPIADVQDEDADEEAGESRVAFTRDSFRRMIARTFEDYYPGKYNTERLNIEEYMALIQAEQLEAKFSVYLETNTDNILTVKSMPWLDIGDLPPSY